MHTFGCFRITSDVNNLWNIFETMETKLTNTFKILRKTMFLFFFFFLEEILVNIYFISGLKEHCCYKTWWEYGKVGGVEEWLVSLKYQKIHQLHLILGNFGESSELWKVCINQITGIYGSTNGNCSKLFRRIVALGSHFWKGEEGFWKKELEAKPSFVFA